MSDAATQVSSSPGSSTPPALESTPRPDWAAPALIAVGYLVFWQIAPRVRVESVGVVLASTLLSLALLIWFASRLARGVLPTRTLVWSLAVSALLVIPLKTLLFVGNPTMLWLHGQIPGLVDILFVWFAASLGALLSLLLRGANMIPPVAAVLALVDTWTVLLGGPVQRIMQSGNPLMQRVTSAMTVEPPRPQVTGAAPAALQVGFADFLFIAFFIAAISRFVPQAGTYSRTVGSLIMVLCAYMVAVSLMPNGLALPALVPMAVVMIGLHWRHFHYDRSEAFALIYAAAFIALIAAGFWYFGQAGLPTKPGYVRGE